MEILMKNVKNLAKKNIVKEADYQYQIIGFEPTTFPLYSIVIFSFFQGSIFGFVC